MKGGFKWKWNEKFADNLKEYIGCEYVIPCGNGLDALRLIFRAYKEMGIMKDGDEVIVPANTYIATVLAITDNNLVPVLLILMKIHIILILKNRVIYNFTYKSYSNSSSLWSSMLVA